MTPSRRRARMRPAASWRVVSRTRAGWSPGEAPGGGTEATWRTVLAPGAIRSLRGRSRSQPTAPRAGRTRGLPWSERANSARDTLTSRGSAPEFRTVIADADAPLSVKRSGLALSPMSPPAAAPGMDAAAVASSAAAAARLTSRSP